MSVTCDLYTGYTVDLTENITDDQYELFGRFSEQNPEYDQYNRNGSKAKLIVDGMNGEYARLIYITNIREGVYIYDNIYEILEYRNVPDEVYQELNKAYKLLYEKDLDRRLVRLVMWTHWS